MNLPEHCSRIIFKKADNILNSQNQLSKYENMSHGLGKPALSNF